jgi:hypothetical protein
MSNRQQQHEQRKQFDDQQRRRRILAVQLQERNQGLQETIDRLSQEIALNQQVIEELLEDPSDGEDSEEYVDSVAESESFREIASVEIIEPPRIPHSGTNRRQGYSPRAATGGPSSPQSVATSKKKATTPKKKTKKDERKESLEKARAWAIDRKNARDEKEKAK